MKILMNWKILRNRNVKYIFGGTTSTLLGDQLHEIALLWMILMLSGSANEIAIAMLASRLPIFLIGLVGGVYSDRWDKRKTFIVGNILLSMMVISIPIMYYFEKLTVSYLIITALVIGIGRCFIFPAYSGIVPQLIEKKGIQNVNVILDTTKRTARSVGPGIGGIITQYFSIVTFFIIDSLSYLLSAFFVFLTKPIVNNSVSSNKTKTTFWMDLREIWEYIHKKRTLKISIIGFGLYNVAYALGYWIGIPGIANSLTGDPSAYNFIIASFGLGGLFGNFILGYRKMVHKHFFVFVGIGIVGCGFLLLGFSPNIYFAYLFSFICAIGLPFMDIGMITKIQEETRHEMIGRVFSFWRTIAEAGIAVGLIFASFSTFANYPQYIFIFAGTYTITISVSFVLMLIKSNKYNEKVNV